MSCYIEVNWPKERDVQIWQIPPETPNPYKSVHILTHNTTTPVVAYANEFLFSLLFT